MIDVRPVLIMAGGTGGHVFPALAVADELRLRGVKPVLNHDLCHRRVIPLNG